MTAPSQPPHLIFVYGSLMRGQRYHAEMRDAVFVGPATTQQRYAFYSLGDYPALVAGGTQSVEGELYRVDDRLRQALDIFEEHPHVYQRQTIVLADGREAETYLLHAARLNEFHAVPLRLKRWHDGA